ncbi:type II toxin-antitoxin system RelE/ParE family toxin [Alterinioella nitratireducens]|uniref:type II toxin-antitoxin system RelE/ParE family toxin n=1 Tax=Alterinioella nitratireducens TaxID=2735915 RepID=UPI000C53C7F9|nr:plasmid stabilization protein ParE [Nioella sp.]
METTKRVHLRRTARADLADIWNYGAEEWGTAQADRYARNLSALFRTLAEMPGIGREHVEFEPPVRIHPSGPHLVIYRATTDGIEVLRIMGALQNWRAALRLGD